MHSRVLEWVGALSKLKFPPYGDEKFDLETILSNRLLLRPRLLPVQAGLHQK